MGSSSSKTTEKSGDSSSGFHVLELHGASCIVAIVALILCLLMLFVTIQRKCYKLQQSQQQQHRQHVDQYPFVSRLRNSFRRIQNIPCESPPEQKVEPPWQQESV